MSSVTTQQDLSPFGAAAAEAPLARVWSGIPRLSLGADVSLAAILLGLVATVYWRTVVELVGVWNTDPSYSHGYLIPLGSLVFAGIAWRRHGAPVRPGAGERAVLAGTLKVLLGLGLHAVAVLAGNLLLDVVSMIFVVRGTLLLVGGREANRAFGFSAVFLVFMAPLPTSWYQPVALGLQHVASAVSAQVLELCGAAVHREGYRLLLPTQTLLVGEACSGLRGLMGVVVLAVVVGRFTGQATWYRAALTLLAMPIAVVTNSLRVVLIGGIYLLCGARWAEGVFHTFEGVVMLAVSAVVVLLVAAWLSQWAQRGEIPPVRRGLSPRARGPLVAAVAILSAGWAGDRAWSRHLEAAGPRPGVSLARPISSLPMTLGEWQGAEEPVPDPQWLYADEHVHRTYRHLKRRQTLSVWLAYSRCGADRSHHPEVCMKVAGQPEDVAARRPLPVEGHAAPIQQYRFGRIGQWQGVFYWHYTLPLYQDGELDLCQRIYRQTHHRPASVTLEVFAPERMPHDDASAQEFVRLLDRAIQAHVGPAAVRGSNRQPIDG